MQTPKTTWTWKVTYQTAAIASGNAETKELAEAKAVQVHDRNVVAGLNPDWLAYFVNEEPNPHVAANRAARVAKIVAHLDTFGEQPDAQLRRIDMDATWCGLWTAALGFGARCPSDETRADVREVVRARIPEPYVLTDEDRALIEQMENDAAYDRLSEDGFDTMAEAELSR